MEKHIYETDFSLEFPVNDYNAAKEYLENITDMTDVFKERVSRTNMAYLQDKVKDISWKLDDESNGRVVITTDGRLSSKAQEYLADWISGQNSDGIGNSFEQQPFALTVLDEDDFDAGYEDSYITSSFDWTTNEYELHETVPEIIEEAAPDISLTEEDLAGLSLEEAEKSL